MDKKTEHMILGGVASAGFDTLIDYPLAQLLGGKLPVIQIRDLEGRYIWGVGLGDITGAGVGTALYLLGKKNKAVRNFGVGWLLSLGVYKATEFLRIIHERVNEMFPYIPEPIFSAEAERAGASGGVIVGSPATAKNGYRQRPTIQKTTPQPAQALFV